MLINSYPVKTLSEPSEENTDFLEEENAWASVPRNKSSSESILLALPKN